MTTTEELNRSAFSVKLIIRPGPKINTKDQEVKTAAKRVTQNARTLIYRHHQYTIGWSPAHVYSYDAAKYHDYYRHAQVRYHPDQADDQVPRILPISDLETYRSRLDPLLELRTQLRRQLQELLPDHQRDLCAEIHAGYLLGQIPEDHSLETQYGRFIATAHRNRLLFRQQLAQEQKQLAITP